MGIPVGRLGAYAGSCTNSESAIIGYTVETVDSYCFAGATSLKSINFPSTARSFGSHLMQGCTSLTEVRFTAPITYFSIQQNMFQGCTKLTTVVLPTAMTTLTVAQEAFSGCTSLETFDHPDLTYLNKQAFSGCSSLKSMSFSSKIKTIGAAAFENCVSLSTVFCCTTTTITTDATGDDVFKGCTALSMVLALPSYPGLFAGSAVPVARVLESDCKTYATMHFTPSHFFTESEQFTESNIFTPSDFFTVDPAFEGSCMTENGRYHDIGKEFPTDDGLWVYKLTSSTSFSVNKGDVCPTGKVTIPATYTFDWRCSTVPVKAVADGCFQNCTEITGVDFVGNVETIGECAFMGCDSLANVDFPESLRTIGGYAFCDTKLVTVMFPNNTFAVSDSAFFNCTKLRTVMFEDYDDESQL